MEYRQEDRREEYDMLQLVRTEGGYLAVLHFLAYYQDDHIELVSQTWDGMLYPDEAMAGDAMKKMAARYNVDDRYCLRELLYGDPFVPRQYQVVPWRGEPITGLGSFAI